MPVLHEYITKNGLKVGTLTPVKAIRQKCLDCCAWQSHEVRLCPCTDCSLFPYRFGKKPKPKHVDGA